MFNNVCRAAGLHRAVPQLKCEESVEAEAGGMVVLPCITEPQSPIRMVDWTTQKNMFDYTVHAYRSQKNDLSEQSKEYQSKTSLFDDKLSSGNCSLKLSEVPMSFGGTYTCFVKTGNGKTYNCVVKLTVRNASQLPAEPPPRSDKNGKKSADGTKTGISVGAIVVFVGTIIIANV